jgi:hypothetical protein
LKIQGQTYNKLTKVNIESNRTTARNLRPVVTERQTTKEGYLF